MQGLAGGSVVELLGAEHERLDELLREVRAALGAGRLEQAAAAFAEFRSALECQMRVEEDVLFRELERGEASRQSRPTLDLWMEHGELRTLLEQARRDLTAGTDALATLEQLRGRLKSHRSRESGLLQALSDGLQEVLASTRLVQRMQICLTPFY
jgi:hypothetical protein